MAASTPSNGIKTSFANTPQAADDSFAWTEDALLATSLYSAADSAHRNVITLNVMANDLGGNAKTLFSIDDGNGHTSATDNDLLTADTNGAWETTSNGNLIRIYNGAVQIDVSHSLALLGATDVNALAAGDAIHDEFVYAIRLGNGTLSQAKVSIDLQGQNDDASITGVHSGSLTEDTVSPVTGTLTVTDPDHGQSQAQAASGAGDNNLGTYTVDAGGHWSYTVNNAAVQHLNAGATTTDTFMVTSLDGTAHQQVTVTIAGLNDAATIGGDLTGTVTEDGTLTAQGVVSVLDPDDGQNHAYAASSLHGTYGDFTFDGASGGWTYALRNDDPAVQALGSNSHVHDVLTLTSDDGTDTRTIDVTVNGQDDRPTAIVYVTNAQLWVTDGNGPGHALEDQFLFPRDLTVSGGSLYFNGDFRPSWFDNLELWKSDGTSAGTSMVANIVPGPGGANPTDLTDVGGKLYFLADDGVHGRELWTSDGTEAGTRMVADMNPGPGNFSPFFGSADLTAVGDKLYFVANDGTHGNQLWISDGTAGGTQMLTDMDNGGVGPVDLTDVNGVLYFAANDAHGNLAEVIDAAQYTGSTHGWELWRSDGTAAGTAMVEDLNRDTHNPPGYVDGTYYADGSWKVHSSSPQGLTNVDGTLYYVATADPEGENGNGPWGLRMLAPGQDHSELVTGLPHVFGRDLFSFPTEANGLLYFGNVSSNDPFNNNVGLWRSDGTAAGTFEIQGFSRALGNEMNNSGSSDHVIANVNGTVFFAGKEDPAGGTNFHDELWKTNGTTATLVHDFGTDYNRLDDFTNVNGTLYFVATTSFGQGDMWKSDGTEAGTVLVTHGVDYTQGIWHL